MSATNRGAVRNEQDFYATPEAAFKPLLQFLPLTLAIWEPACGDGRLIRWMNGEGLNADGSDLELSQDFLTDDTLRECIVTNPPFSLAAEFVRHCAEVTPEFYLLLRLNFLAGIGRRETLWEKNPPQALFILSARPSFGASIKCRVCDWRVMLPAGSSKPKACPECGGETTKSDSDACDYAWFYWGQEHRGIYFLGGSR